MPDHRPYGVCGSDWDDVFWTCSVFQDGVASDIALFVRGPWEGTAACCLSDERISKVGVVAVRVADLEGMQGE